MYNNNNGKKNDYNIYSKLNKRLSNSLNGYIDLQYRRVDYSFIGKDSDASPLNQSVEHNFFNPKIGLSYIPANGWNAYASFAVANREPNRQDYIDSSPDSQPIRERLLNTEVGIRKTSSRFTLGANFYHMLYDDQLVLTGKLNDVGEITRINVPDSYRLGFEVDGSLMSENGIFINGNLTLSQNKIKRFEEGIDNWEAGSQDLVVHENTDLSFSPKVISAIEIGYNLFKANADRDLELSLQNKFVGKQYIDNTSNKNAIIDSYQFTNLKLSLLMKDVLFNEIIFRFQINNLFDTLFESNAWIYRFNSPGYNPEPDDPYARQEVGNTYNLTGYYPQAGRNYMLGVQVGF
jgi:iron complex outermembrane receptor protein